MIPNNPLPVVNRAFRANDVPVLGPVANEMFVYRHARLVLHADAVRHGVLFHNPNEHVTVRVLPAGQHCHSLLQPFAGGIPIGPLECFEVYASGGGSLPEDVSRLRVNTAWQGVADTGDDDAYPLTIWDFTDRTDPHPDNANGPQATTSLWLDPSITSPLGVRVDDLTQGSRRVLEPRVSRRGITFLNPGTVIKAVAPSPHRASLGLHARAGSLLLRPGASKELRAFGKVRVNTAWEAATDSPVDGTLTILEFV